MQESYQPPKKSWTLTDRPYGPIFLIWMASVKFREIIHFTLSMQLVENFLKTQSLNSFQLNDCVHGTKC